MNALLNTASVVIPVYNSEHTLVTLVARLEPVLHSHFEAYELLLVNDGSHDASWQVIKSIAETKDWVTGIQLMRNFGQHNAILCGIRHAQYDIIITLDDDLQNPPEEIPKLVGKLKEGYDVVYGTPQAQKHGLLRNLASSITKLALKGTMGIEIATKVSAFRAFRAPLMKAFADYRGSFVAIDVLLTWGARRFTFIYVEHEQRQQGSSNYTFMKLLRHALNMITGFSVLPLQLASVTGFGFVIFGIIVLIYVIGRFIIEGGSVQGFPFLASIIAIFAGVQLFALGIMGEYMARMYMRLMDIPTYVVDEITHSNEDTNE